MDVWSDLVCPWCYVGKRRFETALEQFDHRADVQVVHRSFQLNPAAPRDRTSERREMLMQKYRLSPAQVEEMDARMTQVAAAEGLEFHLEGTVTGNTFDAHQLVHLGRERGMQDPVVERLYRAYFTEQRSLFTPESLLDLAADAGLDRDEAADVLRTNRYAEAVAADVATARRLGATGVPLFVVDDRYGISGAQTPEVFLDVLQRAAAAITTP
ncbi:MAG TPA: DsbA family oxidoreductase [Vicinamibacterales bacterium]|nr:DsbA family oxidoreductase [Vicinamibacterales bacterium]